MDFETHKTRLLQHYVCLAQIEGWGRYTRERLTLLAKDPLYADLPQLVTEALAILPAPSSSPMAETATPTPPA